MLIACAASCQEGTVQRFTEFMSDYVNKTSKRYVQAICRQSRASVLVIVSKLNCIKVVNLYLRPEARVNSN